MKIDHKELEACARRPTFIDLFSGCGGLSLGLMNAGWLGKFAIEKDPFAFETLRYNLVAGDLAHRFEWPGWLPISNHEISQFTKKYCRNLRKLRGKIDLIAGGPPCQGFSFVGRRLEADPRNRLFLLYCNIVEIVQPDFILLENVAGITIRFQNGESNSPRPYSALISESLAKVGYTVFSSQLKSVDYGVPQLRPRIFFFGAKTALVGKLKRSLFERVEAGRAEFLKHKGLPTSRPINVKEALSDLETAGHRQIECLDFPGFNQILYGGPQSEYQKLMHGNMAGASPNSSRLVKHRPATRTRFGRILATFKKGGVLPKSHKHNLNSKKRTLIRLIPSKPSHTLTTLPDDILHYSEPRILTVREYARLQSFPDWYAFNGAYTTGGLNRIIQCPRYSQVGNAVPPLLAEAIGVGLRECVEEIL